MNKHFYFGIGTIHILGFLDMLKKNGLLPTMEEALTDHDAEIPAWIPEKYFLTVNFEAL